MTAENQYPCCSHCEATCGPIRNGHAKPCVWCDQFKPDDVNSPGHYRHGSIEPIDVIEDWKLDYLLGTVVKYVARHEHKGNALKDLRKAEWFLRRKIAKLEGEA